MKPGGHGPFNQTSCLNLYCSGAISIIKYSRHHPKYSHLVTTYESIELCTVFLAECHKMCRSWQDAGLLDQSNGCAQKYCTILYCLKAMGLIFGKIFLANMTPKSSCGKRIPKTAPLADPVKPQSEEFSTKCYILRN